MRLHRDDTSSECAAEGCRAVTDFNKRKGFTPILVTIAECLSPRSLARLAMDNLAPVHGEAIRSSHFLLVFRLCCGTLAPFQDQGVLLPETEVLLIFRDTLMAVLYLHSRKPPIAHRQVAFLFHFDSKVHHIRSLRYVGVLCQESHTEKCRHFEFQKCVQKCQWLSVNSLAAEPNVLIQLQTWSFVE